jgi:hypothetical protein
MGSKRKRRSEEVRAKKKRKGIRLFLLSVIMAVALGFLVFVGISLYDFVGPSNEKGVLPKKENRQAVLYFSDAQERFLVPAKRLVPEATTAQGRAEELVKALIEGPGAGLKELTRTIPEGTKLRGIRVEAEGTAFVDFDGSIVDRHPGGSASEVATVYSLVNTLTQNVPEIKAVKVLVEGKPRETLKGHLDLGYPLRFNGELIKEQSPTG